MPIPVDENWDSFELYETLESKILTILTDDNENCYTIDEIHEELQRSNFTDDTISIEMVGLPLTKTTAEYLTDENSRALYGMARFIRIQNALDNLIEEDSIEAKWIKEKIYYKAI